MSVLRPSRSLQLTPSAPVSGRSFIRPARVRIRPIADIRCLRQHLGMTDEELAMLFMPHDVERRAALAAGKRLVHYTSAEAGFRIISGRQVWLRNALLMNDFSEIQHGLSCLQAAWASPSGELLRHWLDEHIPGFTAKIVAAFDTHAEGLKVATFMMSLSEHNDDEDELGRLSMWRAYGGRSGLALVLNPLIFTTVTDALKAYSAPVSYQDITRFCASFDQFVQRIMSKQEELTKLDPERLLGYFFYTFRMFVLCTKHPGFHEEREWRVFHSPLIDGTSNWLRKENEVLNGTPQEVVKLALHSDVSAGVAGLDPAELVNRIIIGPSQHPVPIFHALHNALTSVGIADASARLWMSLIPLRQ